MVFFRVDANSTIGTGHFNRCLLFGKQLSQEGIEVRFLTNSTNEDYLSEVEAEYKIIRLPSEDLLTTNDIITAITEDSSELGYTLVTDTDDAKYYESAFQQELIAQGIKLMTITIRPRGHNYAHLVLNQNYVALSQSYEHADYTKLLLGPHYISLRKDFREGRSAEDVNRNFEGRPSLLLSFGGADQQNVTINAVKAVGQEVEQMSVAVGPLYKHLSELDTLDRSADNLSVHFNTPDMAELMSNSDIAITSCGSTLWELCFMGVPRIAVSTSEREKLTGEALGKDGLVRYAGHIDQEDIYARIGDELRYLLQNRDAMREMSQKGIELLDGKGMGRVIREIIGLVNSN